MEKSNYSPGKVFGFLLLQLNSFLYYLGRVHYLVSVFSFPGLSALLVDIPGIFKGRSPKLSRCYINLGKEFKINHTQKLGPSHMEKTV